MEPALTPRTSRAITATWLGKSMRRPIDMSLRRQLMLLGASLLFTGAVWVVWLTA